MKKVYEIDGEEVSAEDYWFYRFAVALPKLQANAHALACERGYIEALSIERREQATRVHVGI